MDSLRIKIFLKLKEEKWSKKEKLIDEILKEIDIGKS
jgi:hypothetical protein